MELFPFLWLAIVLAGDLSAADCAPTYAHSSPPPLPSSATPRLPTPSSVVQNPSACRFDVIGDLGSLVFHLLDPLAAPSCPSPNTSTSGSRRPAGRSHLRLAPPTGRLHLPCTPTSISVSTYASTSMPPSPTTTSVLQSPAPTSVPPSPALTSAPPSHAPSTSCRCPGKVRLEEIGSGHHVTAVGLLASPPQNGQWIRLGPLPSTAGAFTSVLGLCLASPSAGSPFRYNPLLLHPCHHPCLHTASPPPPSSSWNHNRFSTLLSRSASPAESVSWVRAVAMLFYRSGTNLVSIYPHSIWIWRNSGVPALTMVDVQAPIVNQGTNISPSNAFWIQLRPLALRTANPALTESARVHERLLLLLQRLVMAARRFENQIAIIPQSLMHALICPVKVVFVSPVKQPLYLRLFYQPPKTLLSARQAPGSLRGHCPVNSSFTALTVPYLEVLPPPLIRSWSKFLFKLLLLISIRCLRSSTGDKLMFLIARRLFSCIWDFCPTSFVPCS